MDEEVKKIKNKEEDIIVSEKLLRIKDINKRFCIPTSTVWDWIKKGQFPKPIKLGKRFVVWKESELLAWIDYRQNQTA